MTNRQPCRAAFTMVELMTVMAIIVILVTILIPVVSKVRTSANTAAVKAEIMSIEAAIDRYQQTFGAYPGPIADDNMGINPVTPFAMPIKGITTGATYTHVTGTENLVLGLMGGLTLNTGAGGGLQYDAGLVGKGPQSLSALNPKAYPSFIDGVPMTTSNGYNAGNPGHYHDGAGESDDSNVPEFLDRYSGPMPILYLRARTGASGVVSIGGQDSNGWVIATNVQTQYDLNQILGYTQGKSKSIGEGKSIKASQYTTPPPAGYFPQGLRNVTDTATLEKGTNYVYPYDAFPYFVDRNSPPSNNGIPNINATGQPKMKDKYILISAGPDRVYGTADDITNFGDIGQ